MCLNIFAGNLDEFENCTQFVQKLLRCPWIPYPTTSKLVSPHHLRWRRTSYSPVCKNIMCYHTLDAFVIQALRSRWICDPTPPRWFEWFFAEKPQKSSATAYKHKDCSDAIGSQIKRPPSSYHHSIQAAIAPYVFSHGRVWGAPAP